jgi:hypothetical protein
MKRPSPTSAAAAVCVLLLLLADAGRPDTLAGQATSDGTTPVPDRLWAAQTAPNAIVLSWRAAPGATAYRLECAVGGAAPRSIGRPAGNATQWQLGLAPAAIGVEHRCTLAVETAAGVSPPTPFNAFVPRASGPPPEAPAGLTAQQTAPAEITLSWSGVPGATAYFLARALEPEGFRVLCQVCPIATSYIDRDVIAGRKYAYSIAAITPGGTSRRTNSNGLVADPAFGQTPVPAGDPVGTGASAGGGGGGSAASGASTAGGGSTGTNATDTSGSATAGSGSTAGTGAGGATGGTGAPASSAASHTCVLEYQRADNMWAALGRPDGQLGTERITLEPGQTRTFVTDWAYEKRRNDGSNYYGSHARIVKNAGGRPVSLHVRGEVKTQAGGGIAGGVMVGLIENEKRVTIDPARSLQVKADLLEVSCSAKQ